MTNRRRIGSEQERHAAAYLQRCGMRILARNFRCRQGEIDLIAGDGDVIVFVEVKYRRNSAHGLPEDAVPYAKMRRICRVADFYMARFRISGEAPFRFDVIAIEGEQLRHHRDAFPYIAAF